MNSIVSLQAVADDDSLESLRRLFSRPPNDWCWCVAWEVGPGGEAWMARTEAENRALRERLWAHGQRPFFLIRSGQAPCGWIKAGPLSLWPVLCERAGLDPEPGDWGVGCVGLDPGWRGRGVMRAAMALLVDAAQQAGARRLFGFPRPLEADRDPGKAWMGPYNLFEALGFVSAGAWSGRITLVKELNP